MPKVTAEARLRPKNQMTLPGSIVAAIKAEVGETFMVEAERDDPDVVRLRRVRRSYAGALRGAFGDADEAAAYLEEERESWAER